MTASAQTPSEQCPDTKVDTGPIKFQNVNGAHVISAFVNSVPVKAIIDTGAPDTVLSVEFLEKLQDKIKIMDSVGVRGDKLKIAKIVVGIGKIGVRSNVRVENLSDVRQALPGIDLIISPSLINCYNLNLSNDNNYIKITSIINRVGFKHIKLTQDRYYYFVNAKIAKNLKLILDTGFNGEISLNSSPNIEKVLGHPLTTVASATTTGVEISKIYKGRKIQIGEMYIYAPHVELFEKRNDVFSDYDGLIGARFLDQYNYIIDFRKKDLWLSPRATPAPAEPRKTAGLLGFPDGQGGFQVGHVMIHSPAEAAGFKTGDRVCAIDGKPIGNDFFATDAHNWGTDKPGKTSIITMCDARVRTIDQKYFY